MQGMLLQYERLRPDLPLRLYICIVHAAKATDIAARNTHILTCCVIADNSRLACCWATRC